MVPKTNGDKGKPHIRFRYKTAIFLENSAFTLVVFMISAVVIFFTILMNFSSWIHENMGVDVITLLFIEFAFTLVILEIIFLPFVRFRYSFAYVKYIATFIKGDRWLIPRILINYNDLLRVHLIGIKRLGTFSSRNSFETQLTIAQMKKLKVMSVENIPSFDDIMEAIIIYSEMECAKSTIDECDTMMNKYGSLFIDAIEKNGNKTSSLIDFIVDYYYDNVPETVRSYARKIPRKKPFTSIIKEHPGWITPILSAIVIYIINSIFKIPIT